MAFDNHLSRQLLILVITSSKFYFHFLIFFFDMLMLLQLMLDDDSKRIGVSLICETHSVILKSRSSRKYGN